MDHRVKDRRSASRDITFPTINGSGEYIGEDRRSGLDRRMDKEDSVAFRILDSIGT
jgi:hypothetical protein